jgi:hypothetical protein
MISSEYKSRAETVLMLFLPCFCLISMGIFLHCIFVFPSGIFINYWLVFFIPVICFLLQINIFTEKYRILFLLNLYFVIF